MGFNNEQKRELQRIKRRDLPSTTVATEKMSEQSRKGPIFSLVGESKNLINVLIAHEEDEAKRKAIVKEEQPRIGTLQLLDLVKLQKIDMEEDRKSLLLVQFFKNGKKERALIDTIAMDNFMIKEDAERLGLKVKEDSSCTIKLPNSVGGFILDGWVFLLSLYVLQCVCAWCAGGRGAPGRGVAGRKSDPEIRSLFTQVFKYQPLLADISAIHGSHTYCSIYPFYSAMVNIGLQRGT